MASSIFKCLGLFLDEEYPHHDVSITSHAADRRAVVADHDVLARTNADPSARNKIVFVCPKRSAPNLEDPSIRFPLGQAHS
jgi:hypothetical protein